jgi:AcrR family transcriptional regulator
MMDRAAPRVRRTQEERTTQTRLALIEATIASIGDHGYAGASTTLIAQRAGVSRGAMLHHFATRAVLMTQVVRHVFDNEMAEYEATRVRTGMGDNLFDWPSLLWSVLSRPPGMAVLEILQATRSDPELAALVVPMQEEVEQSALAVMRGAFGGDEALARTVMRLMVWSVRGLSIADRYLPHRAETEHAILLLGEMMRLAVPDGRMEKMRALIEGKTKG